MSVLDIACATDRRYLPHCAVMIRSLMAEHQGRELRVHVLVSADVTPPDISRLVRTCRGSRTSIIAHRLSPEALDGLPSWGRIPSLMWGRILLPELLPEIRRVLYLDVDVLVVGALDELWRLDLTGSYLAAVTNVPERHRFEHGRDLGLADPRGYFNSGVLLLNLEMLRRDRASEVIRDCVQRRGAHLLWPDQDALNLSLGHRRVRLHPRYNLMNSIQNFSWSAEFLGAREVSEAISDPCIVHFEGPDENKPWHLLCEHPGALTYRRYRRETPWPRMRPTGFTLGNLARLTARRARQALLKP